MRSGAEWKRMCVGNLLEENVRAGIICLMPHEHCFMETVRYSRGIHTDFSA